MSNLSEIRCASDSGKKLKDFTAMNPNSSNKLMLVPGVPVRIVGKGRWGQTKLDFDISLLPGANLYLEALSWKGRIEVLANETSIGQSKMSYLTFVKCSVEPPEPDEKQLALAKMEMDGFHDPSASAWQGWLMLRHAALTLQIRGSEVYGGAFVKESTNFNLSASQSRFDLKGQGFQLVNVTSHIRLEGAEARSQGRHPSFKMLNGRHEVHVAGSTFYGSGIQIKESLDLILDVSSTRFEGGRRAIDVTGGQGHRTQVDLQDVRTYEASEYGVGASDFHSAILLLSLPVPSKWMRAPRF